MPPGVAFAFGPYQLDLGSRRLIRDGVWIPLTDRQFDLLHAFVKRPGELLPKDVLIKAAWHDVAVDDNSLSQAISHLRRALDAADKDRFIQTALGQGYRFVPPVSPVVVRYSKEQLDAILLPLQALIDGRAAIESLEVAQIARARAIFEPLLVHHRDDERVHVGLANACVMQFESTRTDATPDTAALQLAATHAHEACSLNPDCAEAWATLGFVLERTGARNEALAALRRSVELEPDNWRHRARLSFCSWGEARLRAAHETLALFPGCPLAHLMAATVFVARNAVARAERQVDAGLAEMSSPRGLGRSLAVPTVLLHLLKGLLCFARGADEEADQAFEHELALETRGYIYARECAANTWYAIGAVRLRRGDEVGARAAFEQAVARVPLHPTARAGLTLLERGQVGMFLGDNWSNEPAVHGSLDQSPRIALPLPAPAAPLSVDTAVSRAVVLVAAGDAAGAAHIVVDALASAPAGNAGWLIPIEPLLRVQDNCAAWAPVLTVLRSHAA